MHRVASASLLVAALTSVVWAQSTSASIAGRITDPAGALIVAASIVAINAETNTSYSGSTNDLGQYHLMNLPPGRYRLEIEKSGFKKIMKTDVILHLQDALEINFEMPVGAVSETVTVEPGAPLVNTESATVSTVVDRKFADNIPLNGRTLQTLISLTPGVVMTATAFNDQGQFSVNGQRADANYFTVDGVSANFGVTGFLAMMQSASGALPALSASGGTNSLVSVDALDRKSVV